MVHESLPAATSYAFGSHPRRVFSIRYLLIGFFHGGNTGSNPVGDAKFQRSSRFGDDVGTIETHNSPSIPLSPYRHELNSSGTACAEDCPACRWLRRTSDAPFADSVWRQDEDDTRYVAAALRRYWEHVGMIEGSFADLDAETQSTIMRVAQRIKTEIGERR